MLTIFFNGVLTGISIKSMWLEVMVVIVVQMPSLWKYKKESYFCHLVIVQKLPISIGGIPKTIDNDIAMVDRSFGFETAVQECTRAINSALVEAMSCEYGVGIVKLMGREAGYIAAYATLASHDVDLCLIPEVDVNLYDDEYGILPYIRRCLEKQHHCIVVTSEGIQIPGLEADVFLLIVYEIGFYRCQWQ